MKNVVTMKCVDNSGVYFTADDRELAMAQALTVGKSYKGKLSDGNFIIIDDMGETGVFDAERFN
jgi:hypothetical protein